MRPLCRPLAASVVVIALSAAGVQAAVPPGPAVRAAHAVAARAPERGAAQAALSYLHGLCDRLLAAVGLAADTAAPPPGDNRQDGNGPGIDPNGG